MAKCTKDPIFKAFWDQKSEAAKVQYYRERNKKGKKRMYDETGGTHEERQSVGTDKGDQHMCIPFSVYEREMKMMGTHDAQEILAAWQTDLLNPKNRVMERDGEQLLYRWEGVRITNFERSQTDSSTWSRKKIRSRQDLDEFRNDVGERNERARSALVTASAHLIPDSSKTNLPTHLVRGLVSVDMPAALHVISEIDVLIDIEDKASQFEQELLNQEQIDLSIFQATNKEALAAIEEANLRKNAGKMKMTLQIRVQQTTGTLESQISDAVIDANQCKADAEKVFGANGWKDFETVQATCNEMMEGKETMEKALCQYKKESTDLQKASDTPVACRDALTKLQEFRADVVKVITEQRKKVGAIKAVMRGHEKSLVQGLHAEAEESADTLTCMSLTEAVLLHVCKSAGEKNNVVTSIETAWAVDPKLAMSMGETVWAEQVTGMPTYVGLMKWLTKAKPKGADHVACCLEKPSYSKAFADKLQSLTSVDAGKLYMKITSATHADLMKNIFSMTLMTVDKNWSSIGFLPWSVGHFYFCTSGELLLVGVHADDLSGFSYANKITALTTMKPGDLQQVLDKGKQNFAARLQPGQVLCIPSNVIVHQHAIEQTSFLRWGYMDGVSAAELKKH